MHNQHIRTISPNPPLNIATIAITTFGLGYVIWAVSPRYSTTADFSAYSARIQEQSGLDTWTTEPISGIVIDAISTFGLPHTAYYAVCGIGILIATQFFAYRSSTTNSTLFVAAFCFSPMVLESLRTPRSALAIAFAIASIAAKLRRTAALLTILSLLSHNIIGVFSGIMFAAFRTRLASGFVYATSMIAIFLALLFPAAIEYIAPADANAFPLFRRLDAYADLAFDVSRGMGRALATASTLVVATILTKYTNHDLAEIWKINLFAIFVGITVPFGERYMLIAFLLSMQYIFAIDVGPYFKIATAFTMVALSAIVLYFGFYDFDHI